jgi:hypothetical protein
MLALAPGEIEAGAARDLGSPEASAYLLGTRKARLPLPSGWRGADFLNSWPAGADWHE